ncbi:MAG: neuraminidase-like domain-containing protein [Pseudomonadota bacterium]
MQPIISPIKHDQIGSVAANLIECILFLIGKGLLIYDAPNTPTQDEINKLIAGAKLELAAQVHGKNSQQLVLYFQLQNGLDNYLGGGVDDKTAELLNQLLEKYKAFTTGKIFVVTGVVTDSMTGARQSNILIKAFDRDGTKLTPLGETTTNSSGEYRVTFPESAYKNTPAEREGVELVVKAFDEFTSGVGKTTVTTSEQNVILNIATTSDVWTVEGRVTRGDAPVNQVLIEVFDRDLRTRQVLGKTTTKNGHYRVAFRTQDFQRGDKKVRATPWLIVIAKETENSAAVVIEKSQGVTRHNTIDFRLKEDLPSEFEKVSKDLPPLLEFQHTEYNPQLIVTHVAPQASGTTLSVGDITTADYYFLERETGFDKNIIDAWVRSFKINEIAMQLLSDHYALERSTLQENGWSFFYAFARNDLNADINAIVKLSSEKLKSTWSNARAQNRVPELNEKTIAILINAVEIIGKLLQLTSSNENNNDFARLVSAIPVELPQNIALDALAIYHEQGFNDPDAFLELKNKHPNSETGVNRLVRHIRVDQLVDGHNEFSKIIHTKLTDDSDSIAPLAILSSHEWIDVATQANLDASEAMHIQRAVEVQHPIVALRSRLSAGHLSAFDKSRDEIDVLLKNDSKKIENILKGNTPIKDDESISVVESTLKNFGRFARAGLTFELSNEFMKGGVATPAAAVRRGSENLQNALKNKHPDNDMKDVLTSFVDNARSHVRHGTAVTLDIGAAFGSPTGDVKRAREIPTDVKQNILNLDALIGDLDQCICKPCESMLGQPAYLVDLLNLLATCNVEKQSDAATALDLLKIRRSNILTLPLSCENTDTEVQHIDLVIELLAEPNASSAYNKTNHAVYPWSLPFDVSKATVKTYLDNINLTQGGLLDYFPNSVGYVAEILSIAFTQSEGTANSEWSLLTKEFKSNELLALYGFKNHAHGFVDPVSGEVLNLPVLDVLRRVSVLLDRTQLDLASFEAVINTQFVSFGVESLSIKNRAQCKTSAMSMNVDPQYFEDVLIRIYRFVRLRNKLPEWSILELDAVLTLCGWTDDGRTSPDDRKECLTALSRYKALSEKFSLSIKYLIGLPDTFSTVFQIIGVSGLQVRMIKSLLQFDPAIVWSFNRLEIFCNALNSIRKSKFSIEQTAEMLLPRAVLESLIHPLPVWYKSDTKHAETLAGIRAALLNISPLTIASADKGTALTQLHNVFDVNNSSEKAWLAAVDIQELVDAIDKASKNTREDTPVLKLVKWLHDKHEDEHIFGEWFPLLSELDANYILAAKANQNPTLEDRLTKLLTAIGARLRERALVRCVSDACAVPETQLYFLLDTRLKISSTEKARDLFLSNSFLDLQSAQLSSTNNKLLRWLDQLTRIQAFKEYSQLDAPFFTLADRVRVSANVAFSWDTVFGNILPATTWASSNWHELQDLIWLYKPENMGRDSLNALYDQVNLAVRDRQTTITEITVKPLVIRAGFSNTDSTAIELIKLKSVTPHTLLEPQILRSVFEILALGFQLGASAIQLKQLTNLEDNAKAASTAIALVESRYDTAVWAAVENRIKDSLRQQQRDALVANLMHTKPFRSVDELYEFYLIDPLMEPCMKTKRVLEAITATQLFIQRILFGLEPTALASPELKQQWQWMRNYRVWEANRKVFLFPENWLFPELRDDKSSSFKQLESALGQGELTQEIAQQSFSQFLDDVAQMGQIEVLGMYEDVEFGAPLKKIKKELGNRRDQSKNNREIIKRDLYVVGRTPNPPYAYYWRKCVDFGSPYMEWAPWQRIELDIQGDHVMPFVLGGQFHVAWPILKYVERKSPEISEWQVSLAWTKMSGQTWKKISVSREAAKINDVAFTDETRGFSFRCTVTNDSKSAIISGYSIKNRSDSVTKAPDTKGNPEKKYILPPSLYYPNDGSLNSSLALDNLVDLVCKNYEGLPAAGNPDNFPAINNIATINLMEHFEVFSMMEKVKGNWTYDGLKDSIFSNPALAYRLHRIALINDPSLKPNLPQIRTGDLTGGAYTIFTIGVMEYSFNRVFKDFLKGFRAAQDIPARQAFDSMFNNNVQPHASLKIISCQAWLKIKASPTSTTIADREIDGRNGQFSCVINNVIYPLRPGSRFDILKLGKQKEDTEIILTITLNGTTLDSNPEKLVAVNSGKSVDIDLSFKFDSEKIPEKFRNKFIKDLGINLVNERKLGLTLQFELSNDDSISISNQKGSDLSVGVSNSYPWMNGYSENIPLSEESPTYPINISNIEIMPSSMISQFWVVGASSSHGVSSKIWHYSESNHGGFIDVGFVKTANDRGLGLYPDTYSEAANAYRINWNQTRSLLQPDVNTGSFSTRNIPSLSARFNTKDWIELQDGKLAFDARLPNALYNWEVFLHAPLLIADQLSKNHKYQEAEQWFHYIFNPTNGVPRTNTEDLFNFRVFKTLDARNNAFNDLTALAQSAAGFYTDAEQVGRVKKMIDRWRTEPFRPFAIARGRSLAFLWRTLFAYLDNLMSWADNLYRRDTRESINEAMMIYVFAQKILGRKPQQHVGTSKSIHTYNDYLAHWDEFANFWIDVGGRVLSEKKGGGKDGGGKVPTNRDGKSKDLPLPTVDGSLYFCMPFNDKILKYWNMIDDRLFNLRHCRNIEGITRDLPFTDAPIDPELLIRATAAGLDLGDVISGLYAPPPHYRYNILAARAGELINETKSLGAALLSAIEKRDAEHISKLRSSNEISLLKLVSNVKQLQITEAERNIEALRASRKSTENRYSQYQRLIGTKDVVVPKENETAGEVAMLGSQDAGLSSHRSGLGLIKEENEQYLGIEGANTWSTAASITKILGGGFHLAASVLAAIPMDKVTNAAKVAEAIGTASSHFGDAFSMVSQGWRTYAEQQGMLAGHLRRRDEWAFQSNQTLKELQQIDKQLLANQIRIDITQKELANHFEQMEQSKAMDEVLRSKFTNEQLYQWMLDQLSQLYFSTYRMALDMARRAERAASRELGTKPLNILGNDYWGSLRMGLLAGEKLHQDLKRLEISYIDQNRREYELTKHISLRRLNSSALMDLRFKNTSSINSCTFDVPEWLFDVDTPGHYLRRIKSVSVSIPCVVGPYTSVNCKLTLLKSEIRHDRTSSSYLRVGEADPSFTDYFGASEAIVTSSANADSGLFETPLHDERFLPFEHAGAISRWRLELPDQYAQFDYSTISDVILTIRYTARDGGEQLKAAAVSSIRSLLTAPASADPKAPLRFPLLLSCRADFPTEWAHAKTTGQKLTVSITKDFIPYWLQAASISTFHLIGVKKIVGQVMSDVTGTSLAVVGGVTKVDTNVQVAQPLPFPSDIFLLMELGIN